MWRVQNRASYRRRLRSARFSRPPRVYVNPALLVARPRVATCGIHLIYQDAWAQMEHTGVWS
jgi:hypothetical protein